ADSLRQRKRRGLARRSVGRGRKELEPTGVDVRAVFLRIDEVGNEPDIVDAEPSALHERSEVVPGVEELLGRILGPFTGAKVDAAYARREEQVARAHQVRRHTAVR